jgi:hypothetical protein
MITWGTVAMLRASTLCILLAIAAAACAPVSMEPPPADGVMVVRAKVGSIRAVAPPVARGELRRVSDQFVALRGEPEPGHTVAASIVGGIQNEAGWLRATSGLTNEERLRVYVDDLEMAERATPGREGAILRTWEHLGDARPPHAAIGIACEEHLFVSEDRQVPGAIGQAYVFHAITYSCIDPRSGFPVELGYSERFPEATATLRPEFTAEAESYFSSLRFE